MRLTKFDMTASKSIIFISLRTAGMPAARGLKYKNHDFKSIDSKMIQKNFNDILRHTYNNWVQEFVMKWWYDLGILKVSQIVPHVAGGVP